MKPQKPRFGANANVPSSKLSQLADLADFAAVAPACIASRVATQSLSTGVATLVTFDTEVYDGDSMFVASSTSITIATPGVYQVSGWCVVSGSNTGLRVIELIQNGAIVLSHAATAPTTADTRMSLSNMFLCSAGDTWGLQLFQNSGGSMSITGARLAVGLFAAT